MSEGAQTDRTTLIAEILALYKKHGWTLRQVLLTEKSKAELGGSLNELFGEVGINVFARDAAWFSRRSGENGVAWEIRLLSENPFALIDVFGPDQDEDQRNKLRRSMEEKITGTSAA